MIDLNKPMLLAGERLNFLVILMILVRAHTQCVTSHMSTMVKYIVNVPILQPQERTILSVPSSLLGLRIKRGGGIGLDTIWIYPNHLSCIIGMSIIGNLHTQHVTGRIFNIFLAKQGCLWQTCFSLGSNPV